LTGHHDVARLHQALHQEAVARLDDDSDLSGIGLEACDPCDEAVHGRWGVPYPGDGYHAIAGPAERDYVVFLGPIDPNSDHSSSLPGKWWPHVSSRRRRGAVLMDQSSWDDTLLGLRPPGSSPGNAVSTKSSRGRAPEAFPGRDPDRMVEASAPDWTNVLDAGEGRRRVA
jgi:hypothetical protein